MGDENLSEEQDCGRKNKCIGVCFAGIEADYQLILVNAMEQEAKRAGYEIMYFAAFSSSYISEKHDIGEMNIFQLVNFKLLDALILLSETIKLDETLRFLTDGATRAGIPVISIDRQVQGCYNILFNYKEAMEKIVRHMVEFHGFRTIEFIGGAPDNPQSEERLQIYLKILEENQIPVAENRLHYGYFWAVPTEQVMDKILSEVRAGVRTMAEAFLCANDTMAMVVHRRLKEAGYRIPEDVAISGFDGLKDAANLEPAITTAMQDFDQAGIRAMETVRRLFAGESPPGTQWLDFAICFKESCGCRQHKQTSNPAALSELIARLEDFQLMSKKMSCMTSDLMSADSLEYAGQRLQQYTMFLHAEKIWVCIRKDFIHMEPWKEENRQNNTEKCGWNRLTSQMQVLLYKDGEQFLPLPDFPRKEMLPGLEGKTAGTDGLMIMPLHVLDETIGYMAIVKEKKWQDLNVYHSFSMSLSTALQILKFQLEQKQIIRRLDYEYAHDALTGIYNRRGFLLRLSEIFELCLQEKRPMMLMSMDMDGLKRINDVYGHLAGDEAIKVLAEQLSSCMQEGMACARYGGDEFVAAGPLCCEEEAKEYQKLFFKRLDEYNAASKKPYRIQASCGVVTAVPTKLSRLEDFIRLADDLMYRQKAGKKRK